MTPALGMHSLAHDIREVTVAQFTEEAGCCTGFIHTLLYVFHSCITEMVTDVNLVH